MSSERTWPPVPALPSKPSPCAPSPAVTLGLFAAWALHDAEEVAFGPRWVRENVPTLRKRFPRVPEKVWRALEGVTQREFTAAVGVMAVIVGSAVVSGHRTGGRSAYFQAVLDGFGLHGLMHLAQAAAVRGYTPGSATSPVLVLPFTLWARGRLRRAGVLRPATPGGAARGIALAAAATVVSHGVARRLIER
ncbi:MULTISPECIES: HXXEE domain-containing protein [unclassified Streptomyces]|uniref:HXXEE domain-containing protein n=1 Tax=unclassified Streptomyces TaxID=2593676 RepID=UPI00036FB54A|nr:MULTISPECIES: HXXEE domain-containing protein [unclassified Streptomyces]MYT34145.1 HXXEE domain-containing protein [Streptomyces sp. SID8354]